MDNSNKSFIIDWKFSAQDIISNAEEIVGKLPLEYIGEREINGEWKEVVKMNSEEVILPYDNSMDALYGIVGLVNKYIGPRGLWFKKFDTEDDSYKLGLVDFPYGLPAKQKYFTLYFITATDPSGKNFVLSLGNNRFFASKVDVGQSALSVIPGEIFDLTGSNKYNLIDVRPHDASVDRFGNRLPRSIVEVRISYFDPNLTKLKYHVEWVHLPI